MSRRTRNLIQKTEVLDCQSDRIYFINKAIACCDRNDTYGAMQELKRLKLLEDAAIIYRLTRKEIDWNDTTLGVKK